MKVLLSLLLLILALPLSFAQTRQLDLGEARIQVRTIGLDNRRQEEPIIVFESGHGTPMGNWDKVLADSLLLGPVVTYDRPGVGASEPIEQIPTIKNVADRLVDLLYELDLEPPYLLVGHSLGGLYVRGFATYYPDLLAGLIIIDPADFTETQVNKRDYYEVLNWSEERIDKELLELSQKDVARSESIPPALQRERAVLRQSRANDFQELDSEPLPNIPVHILTGGRFDMPKSMRSEEFDNEKLFRSKMKHRVARWTNVIQSVDRGMIFYSSDAGHFVQWDDPKLVVASIQLALKDYYEQQSN